MSVKKIVIEVISMLLVALFLYTALAKLFTFDDFYKQMNNQPLPDVFTPFLVWIVPITELLLAGLLIFERTRLLGLVGSAILMLMFTIYVYLVYYRYLGDVVPCSCGGALQGLDWDEHLIFNASFTILSIFGIVLKKRVHNTEMSSKSVKGLRASQK